MLATGPASAVLVTTINSVQGSAYGASSTLGLLPIPATPGGVGLTAPPTTCPATSADDTVGVLNLVGVQVGVVHADTRCEPALPSVNGFVTSNADVAFVGIGVAGVTQLRIDGVNATCRSGRQADGSVHSTGSVSVASIGAQVLGLPVNLPIQVGTIGANTTVDLPVLTGVLGISLFLNEQSPADSFTSPTQKTVNAVRVHSSGAGLLGSILGAGDLIVGHVQCRADFTTVDVTTSTSSTSSSSSSTSTSSPSTSTSTSSPSTTSTTVGATTSSTSTTSTTTSTTVAATTTTTSPPTGTVVTTTTLPTATTVFVPPTILVRTGANLQPLAILSGLSVVLGILLLIGSNRPLTSNVGGTAAAYGMYSDGTPEKWGPLEIAKTIWAGSAALLIAASRLFSRRR